jgi:phytoene dehydrogenase-like protein
MFRAIFLEGFARPYKGVRLILKNLVKRFRSLGGELRLRQGVQKIHVENNRAVSVELDNGDLVYAKRILSSAGHLETLRMCSDCSEQISIAPGTMTFVESVSILDRQPTAIGHDETIVFYNDSPTFHWHPAENDMCDPRTGVVCSPNNYLYGSEYPDLKDGIIRITTIAGFQPWDQLDPIDYQRQKARCYDLGAASSVRFIPDFRPYVIESDVFTPTTIRRFTWHENGAVYGAPEKKLDGRTHLDNLFLCGTDQGFVGIIGAMISGISMANTHCLRP